MPINRENDWDYSYNSFIRCPFCDSKIRPVDYDMLDCYEEGDHTMDCPICEKEIAYYSECKWEFSTDNEINIRKVELCQ